MSTPAHRIEPFLPPKELGDALAALGHPGYGQRACRRLVRAAKSDGFPVARRKYIRASDAAAFLVKFPDWEPFSKKTPPAGLFSLPS